MNRKDLSIKKRAEKRLENVIFQLAKKGKLPKPLDKLGGARLYATPPLTLGDGLCAVFVWKTAPIVEQRQLYGWLFQTIENGLLPIARMDYHPSHKNLHVVLNCERGLDLSNRGLPGCKEFALREVTLDPDNKQDRFHFITIFCERLNIKLGEDTGLL